MPRIKAQYTYSRSGSTLFHELRVNPSHTEIDECYRIFKDSLKSAIECGDVEKINGKFHLARKNAGIYLPERRWFSLKDINDSKKILKEFKHKFMLVNDWNNIERIIKLTKKLRVKKPTLMAHLIASAWTHDNVNMDIYWSYLDYSIIWIRGNRYIFQDKITKKYIKSKRKDELIFADKIKDAKSWKFETNAWKWLQDFL